MASKKLTALVALSSLSTDDLFMVVNDPAGTPESRKLSFADLLVSLNSRYLVLAGNGAIQSVYGGTSAAGILNLRSTSHATKGVISVTETTAFNLNPWGAGAGETFVARFLELAANGQHFIGLKAADALAASVSFVLPIADGAANTILGTDGAAQLKFLTDLVATGTLQLGGTDASLDGFANINATSGVLAQALSVKDNRNAVMGVKFENTKAGAVNDQLLLDMRLDTSDGGGLTVASLRGISHDVVTATFESSAQLAHRKAGALVTTTLRGGCLNISGTTVPSGGGTPAVIMPDAVSNPTGLPSNTAGCFAKDVAGTTEFFAVDEAGTVTQLSSHNFSMFTPEVGQRPTQRMPWSFYSESPYIGTIGVDMAKAIRLLEDLTGQQLAYYEDAPNKRSWHDDEMAKVEISRQQQADWDARHAEYVRQAGIWSARPWWQRRDLPMPEDIGPRPAEYTPKPHPFSKEVSNGFATDRLHPAGRHGLAGSAARH